MSREDVKARSDRQQVVDELNHLVNDITGEASSSNKYKQRVEKVVRLFWDACKKI